LQCEEYFQRLRRHAYVTPKSYLSFINSYIGMYTRKRDELLETRERLQTGIEKLDKAAQDIEAMKARPLPRASARSARLSRGARVVAVRSRGERVLMRASSLLGPRWEGSNRTSHSPMGRKGSLSTDGVLELGLVRSLTLAHVCCMASS